MPNQQQGVTLRPEVQAMLPHFATAVSPARESTELIQVSSATKRIAFAYERFRNTLEPDEQEILRRRAILRVLERRLFEDRPLTVIATTLLQELIRGNYIKACPTSLADSIARELAKAKALYLKLDRPSAQWLLSLVAVGVDQQLFPHNRQEALVHLMYHDTYRRLVWTDDFVAETDRATQLYLACHRTLYAADDYELAYHYFIRYFPSWQEATLTPEEILHLVRELPAFKDRMTQDLNHSARDRLTRLLRPVAVPYIILRDILIWSPTAAFASLEALQAAGSDAFTKRVQLTRSRMSRRAWHSILFLFLTKTTLALLFEVPYERIVLGEIHVLALLSNITFHPILLLTLATTVRLPGQANAERVVEHLERIVTGEGELPTVAISKPRRYGAATWSVFALLYAVLFMLIFWGLFSLLDYLGFSLLAMFFFVIFLGLVSFLATRIRRSVDDLRVIPRREGAISVFTSFLALPVLEFGRWLAQNIRQLNFLLFLMDRVLEAPFKLLIDVTEEWFDFVRDRREEIVK